MTVRVRLDLAYDGFGFSGWARQPQLRTVEGVLRDALTQVLRASDPLRLVVAGRTDAGVHASGQVAHVDVPSALWMRLKEDRATVLQRRLSGVLPADLVVRAVAVAAPGFDARFSPVSRSYRYRISDELGTRDPLTRGAVWWYRRPLEVELMAEAATHLLGFHDFAAFCRPRPDATTIRTLLKFQWTRPETGHDAGLVVAELEADAFCHSMVRSLVGACVAVGQGRRPMLWPGELLCAGRREALVAPALGLTLERVSYPVDAELAERAEQTRARRTIS